MRWSHLKTYAGMCTLCLSVLGCGTPTETRELAVSTAKEKLPSGIKAETSMQKWAKSCAMCHVDGTGGAPRVGVGEEWSPRLAQGKAVLISHTIEGFNNMPPLGYCMSCEETDFSSMIDYMTGENL